MSSCLFEWSCSEHIAGDLNIVSQGPLTCRVLHQPSAVHLNTLIKVFSFTNYKVTNRWVWSGVDWRSLPEPDGTRWVRLGSVLIYIILHGLGTGSGLRSGLRGKRAVMWCVPISARKMRKWMLSRYNGGLPLAITFWLHQQLKQSLRCGKVMTMFIMRIMSQWVILLDAPSVSAGTRWSHLQWIQ